MNLKVDVPVAVQLTYLPHQGRALPTKIEWNGRDYPVTQIGYHHHYRQGRTLFHVFSVVSQDTFFRLVLNTDNLFWRLEEISDGLLE